MKHAAKKTEKTDGNKLLTKRNLILGIIILLFAGALVFFRMDADKSDTSSEQTSTSEETTPVDVPDAVLNRWEELEKQADGVSELSDSEKKNFYIEAASLGAGLKKPEAQPYAQEALKLITATDRADATYAQNIVPMLEAIAAGTDYTSTQ